MTHDHDFKVLVRARMRDAGLNYTAARAQLVAESGSDRTHRTGAASPALDAAIAAARAEHERIVARWIVDGRLVGIPAKRKARAHVLLALVAQFAPGRRYPEREVNEILGRLHDDVAFWRRELVDYGYLRREASVYWLPDSAPRRDDFWAQELPDWEALWLPGYLAVR